MNISISKQSIFLYITLSISILYFFTKVVKIELGHLLALIVTVAMLLYLSFSNLQYTTDINTELEYKLNSLMDPDINGDVQVPEYFYIDVDLINLFFSIKQDLSEYNYDAYKNAIECANIVLQVRFDMEKDLCSSPTVPDLQANFVPNYSQNPENLNEFKARYDFMNIDQYDLKQDTKCKSILTNAYDNYQLAEENVKKCMNYIHSMIISVPSEPVIHLKHKQITDRAHILLKRNLDYIKKRYNDSIKHGMNTSTHLIHDYDSPKAINKHDGSYTGTSNALNNFNVY